MEILIRIVCSRAQRAYTDHIVFLGVVIGAAIGLLLGILDLSLRILAYRLDFTARIIRQLVHPENFITYTYWGVWIIVIWLLTAPACRIIQACWPDTFDDPDTSSE
jgi:hypothetical protein